MTPAYAVYANNLKEVDKSLDDGAAQALPDVHVSDKTLSCADVLREVFGPLTNLHDKAPILSL